jgi:hypothetical protein
MLGLSGLPIFFDLKELSIVLSNSPFGAHPSIPLPLGAGVLMLYVLLAFFSVRKFLLSRSQVLLSLLVVSFAFSLSVWNSSYGLIYLFQFFLYLFAFIFIFREFTWRDLERRLYSFFIVFGLFVFLHVVSVSLAGGLRADRYDYVMLFNFEVYQALVSYPAILFLWFSFCTSFIILGEGGRLLRLVLGWAALSCLFLLLASGRRVSILEVFTYISMVSIYLFVKYFLNDNAGLADLFRKNRVLLGKYFLVLTLFFVAFFSSNSWVRLSNPANAGGFDGGRFSNWSEGVSTLLGAGVLARGDHMGLQDDNFHNFLLDSMVRFGGGAAVLFVTFLMVLCFKFYSLSKGMEREAFLLGSPILASIIYQNVFNSAFSQPYYVVNLFFVLSFVFSFLVVRGSVRNSYV